MKGYNWKKGILVLVMSALIGAVAGGGITYILDIMAIQGFVDLLSQITPLFYIVAFLLGVIGMGGYIYFNNKLKKENYQDEEGSFYERHEKMISAFMLCSTLCAVVNFTAIGLNIQKNTVFNIFLIVNVVLAFFGEVLYVALVKKVRPELNADPLDMNFNRNQFDKLDEYEKNKTGKACFKTISVMNIVYVILFVVCYSITIIFEVSPILCLPVGIIWFVQIILMNYYTNKA